MRHVAYYRLNIADDDDMWSFKLRSYFGAVDQRYPETQRDARQRRKRPQHTALLHARETTAGAPLDKCHNAGVNEVFEAWRQFVMEWEPKLRTSFVGLLMDVLAYRFRDDIPNKLAAFERRARHENQSTKTVDDDTKIGVTMLGMEDMRVKEHLIQNSVRITSWNQMRERFSRSGEHNSTSTVNSCPSGANPKSKGKGKGKDITRAKAKAWTSRAMARARMESPVVQEGKERRSETVLLLQQVRKRLKDLAEAEREASGRDATSERHSGRAAAVLNARRGTHDVHHSHALRET